MGVCFSFKGILTSSELFLSLSALVGVVEGRTEVLPWLGHVLPAAWWAWEACCWFLFACISCNVDSYILQNEKLE